MAQHILVRVPWKDNGYDGRVCDKPCYNIACLRLKNIANSRNDSFENYLHGCPILGHEEEIPCLFEGGCFMSPDTYTKTTVHPYKKGNSRTHGHFLETDLIYPPFSFPARPFAWTMLSRDVGGVRKTIQDIADKFGIDYQKYREPDLTFRTNWVQDAVNQREIFRVFYRDVVPNESIVIPYAKQVPFIDDSTRRVVMGIGYITSITEPPEHNHTDQPSVSYNWPSSVSEEVSSDLELAYALTVHKAQGSEFGKVILVLGEPGGMLSKELLYTAITRQKDKLVILYNDGAYRLRDYASAACSEVAGRFTCLFEKPDIVEFKKKYYERALIHKTMRGELVRSKSEVIIANMLFQSEIDYEYEKELDLGEDGIRIPDFTIEDSESGTLFYWEHCGMLGDAGYNRHWQEKKAVYEKHGIIKGKNLIVSEDSISGGIDSAVIKELIDTYLS